MLLSLKEKLFNQPVIWETNPANFVHADSLLIFNGTICVDNNLEGFFCFTKRKIATAIQTLVHLVNYSSTVRYSFSFILLANFCFDIFNLHTNSSN